MVTAVFVNNQHGIYRREQDFDIKFVVEGVHRKRLTDEFPEKSGATSLRQSKGTSLHCNQPALFRATHILSKKITMPSDA